MAWTVQIGGKVDSTELRRPEYLQAQLREDEQPEIRIHRRLVLEPIGIPLQTFGSIQELLSILIDIVDVHESLVNQCDILHRDLSIQNTMCYNFDYESSTWPTLSENTDICTCLAERGEVLKKCKYHQGFLIDFNYAKFMDETPTISEGERMGTIPFMALDILHVFGSETGANVTHPPKHDLESIIYILLWICVLYSGPNSNPLAAHTMCLKPWAECKSLPQVEALWSTKTGELMTHVPLQHFSSYFGGLRPFTQRLYAAILNNHQGAITLTHDSLREILLDAFFQVEELSAVPAKHKGELLASTVKQAYC
ncbi:hypothetical protein JVT61DRAFT_13622 [Boletus reticuloceps]|uniref:Fungal-type protein kinase domain-containing protein n=1 Tax=Boletus reticuloceps TaxID=495285 RepID=A0A8I2YD71_9AGAM|nr:hypothetical protein JVT61DRAFT_13622 [Boletus reticuloceps]